jgi:biotin synthesis protein BioG
VQSRLLRGLNHDRQEQLRSIRHQHLASEVGLHKPTEWPSDVRRLIVYCAGWGTDGAVIQHMQIPANTDLLVCWDYRDLRLDFDCQGYTECHLVAWSMGVWAAEQLLSHWPWRSACAINGTPYPKHAQWGINPKIFDATLEGLDTAGRHKFERRMCSDAEQLQVYQALSSRPLEEIREELQQINVALEYEQHKESQNQQSCLEQASITWTQAIVSEQDRVIPTAHQLAYWQLQEVPIRLVPGAHYLWGSFNAWEQICQL